MKLVTFQVNSPTGVQRRLGALQDERIVDLTTAYATYLAQRTDEPTPRELAQLRTPPDMIGFLRAQEKGRDGTGTVSYSCSVDLHRWPQVGQRVKFEMAGIGTLDGMDGDLASV
jgi:hypothetical protein